MKLSTKSTYGLRAILNVAMEDGGSAVSIADIAKKEDISVDYLEQILNKLRRNGLIESVRGPGGGYVLAREPEKITIADIVRTLEGNIYPVHCTKDGMDVSSCKKGKSCVSKIVWHKLASAISECLESVTLQDLRSEAAKLTK